MIVLRTEIGLCNVDSAVHGRHCIWLDWLRLCCVMAEVCEGGERDRGRREGCRTKSGVGSGEARGV